ncbi:uncharacterized mitochondrial protein-like protein, partial [Tanacetum coccineum]
MRPFGCPVTIFNTIDHLCKFDGKADEGFFVRYSINSKAFRVFNNRTRIVKENLHVQFSENTPNIAGSGPNWLFDINELTKSINYKPVVAGNQSNGNAGTKACDDAGKARMEIVPDKDYILLPLWNADPPISQSSKSSPDDGFKPLRDGEKKYLKNQEKKMDVKSAFLYGKIKEEVHVCQPLGFKDPDFPNRVYKVEKALYGFQRGKIDKNLFIRRDKVKQKNDGIFISKDKYVTEILQKFGFTDVKTASTPMETRKLLLKDKDGEEVDVHLYRSMISSLMYLTSSRPDIMFAVCACARYQVNRKISHLHAVKRIFSDYVGASLDRKFTTGGCQFLGSRLISWQCKKQTVVANSTTEAEYVVASSCCVNLLLLGKVNAARHKLTAAEESILKICCCELLMLVEMEITSLKLRVKKLEKKGGSRTHKLKRLYKVGLSRRVKSSNEEGLGEEDASKQGRIADIDADVGINLVSTHFDADTDMFGVHELDGDEVLAEPEVTIKDVNLSVDEVTLAQALVALKSTKVWEKPITRPRAKGLVIHKQEQASTSIVSSQQPSQLNVRVEADYQLAQRLQAQEQEELTDEEKARLFVQFLEQRRKHFAAKRAEEKRNIPPTRAQQRSFICTYLKNMEGWKPKYLKNKSFANIQELFDKAVKRVNTFVDMDTELVEGSEVRAEGSKTRTEGSSKRAREDLQQESIKK